MPHIVARLSLEHLQVWMRSADDATSIAGQRLARRTNQSDFVSPGSPGSAPPCRAPQHCELGPSRSIVWSSGELPGDQVVIDAA